MTAGARSPTNGRRRVVVTGMGVISPVGNDVESFWESITAGRSGIGPITRFDASTMRTRIAGEIKGYDPAEYFDRRDVRFARLLFLRVVRAPLVVEHRGPCAAGPALGTVGFVCLRETPSADQRDLLLR